VRLASRVDDNQKCIVRALRQTGASVLSLAAIGNGCPDLLVLCAGRLYMLEVKDGDKAPSRQKLTPHQIKFHADWPVVVVNSVESALKSIGVLK
jgi:Holliday junction resolvase